MESTASRGFEGGGTSLGSVNPSACALARAARERRMSAVSGLRVWLTVRHRSISSLRSAENDASRTGGYFPFKILTKSAPWFWALNGCDPVIISYTTHPNDHTSLLWLYGLFLKISGLM